MSKPNSLLQAVLDDPDDLELCQVYADSLTEDLDQRGEFIACQIQLEQLSPIHKDVAGLKARSNRLQFQHAEDWLAAYLKPSRETERYYSRLSVNSLRNAIFRNGFLRRIAVHVDEIEQLWPSLTVTEPVRGVELLVDESIPDDCRDISMSGTWLDLKVSPDDWFTAYSVATVLSWDLGSLKSLDFSGCDLSTDGVQMFSVTEPTSVEDFGMEDGIEIKPLAHRQFTSLKFRNTQIGDEGLQQLIADCDFRSLEDLDVSQCRLEESESLTALTKLKKLARLDISGNSFDVAALADWKGLKKLSYLCVPKETTPESFSELFPTPSSKLHWLKLSGAKALLAQPSTVANAAKKFAGLDLGTTRIGDDGIGTLLAEKSLNTISELKLNGCSLSDKGVTALIESDCHSLVELDLSSNKLTDAGLKLLADWDGLQHVTHLRIGNNRKVTTVGWKALAESPHLNLVHLDPGKVKAASDLKMMTERFGDAVQTG